MRKVSVIVPMYNSERTICECLDSIVGQTIFEDMEAIIVDDCSKDSSMSMVNEYEKKYPDNIMIIRLDENGGPGNARNIALQYASGEYIGFVDSDDAIYPSMYEKMYDEALRTDADYVDCGFYDQKKDKAIVYVSDELAGELNSDKRSSLIVAGGFIWSKVFKRDFLDENNIRFRCEYVLEDMDFLIECTARAQRISNVKEILYIYRDSSQSMSKTAQSLKYIHNQSSAMKAIYDRTHSVQGYEDIRDAVEFTILHLYVNVINTCLNMVYLGEQDEKTVSEILGSLKKMKDAIIKGGYDNPYVRKGISDVNLHIIKANDISPGTVLDLQKNN